MNLHFALVADYAALDPAGKLTIVGVFDRIFTAETPVVWPDLTLLVRLICNRSELGRPQKFTVSLADEDGNKIFEIDQDLKPNVPPGTKPESEGPINQIFRLTNLTFPKFGTYTFDVLLNGSWVGNAKLYVRPRAARPDGS